MPSTNLAAYLAKNYLTASTPSSFDPSEPPKKKRKKSKHQATSGLVIADDDEDLNLSGSHGIADNDDPDAPVTYEGKIRSAEFRKAKKNAWKSVSAAESNIAATNRDDEDNDEADALLRSAQSEESRRLAEQEAENAPAIVGDTIMHDDTPKTESGMKAGLQTAADTARLIAEEDEQASRERSLQKSSKSKSKSTRKSKQEADENENETELHSQTIYRDASGRRIDLSARKQQLQAQQEEEAQKQRQERLDNMGEVQRREAEQRRQDLSEAKFLTIGRGVDDEDMNDHLKEEMRWDDPMADYMLEKRERERERGLKGNKTSGSSPGMLKGKGGEMRKKKYTGPPAQPNRYGILPGWRWDGVDRGNGFEKEWFQARSRRGRNERLEYEWQMDE